MNVNGTMAGNGTGAESEAAYWAGCWFVHEGGAGRAAGINEADRAGDAVGRSRRPRFLQSHVLAGLARGEGERRAVGSAGEEEWRVGEPESEEEGRKGRTGEEWSESRRSCGC